MVHGRSLLSRLGVFLIQMSSRRKRRTHTYERCFVLIYAAVGWLVGGHADSTLNSKEIFLLACAPPVRETLNYKLDYSSTYKCCAGRHSNCERAVCVRHAAQSVFLFGRGRCGVKFPFSHFISYYLITLLAHLHLNAYTTLIW
jgi:hypothetical protein